MKITDEWLYENIPKVEKKMLDKIPDQPEMPFRPSKRYERRMKRLLRQSRHPKMNYRYMKTSGRIAAMVVLCLGIAGASAFGIRAIEPLRMAVAERIVYDDRVVEYYSVTGEGTIKYLTYVPEGYEMVDEDELGENYYWVRYENSFGNFIVYDVWVMRDGDVVSRDTEFVETEEVVVGNRVVQIGYKDSGLIRCSWEEDNALYTLEGKYVEKEELLQMISSAE